MPRKRGYSELAVLQYLHLKILTTFHGDLCEHEAAPLQRALPPLSTALWGPSEQVLVETDYVLSTEEVSGFRGPLFRKVI